MLITVRSLGRLDTQPWPQEPVHCSKGRGLRLARLMTCFIKVIQEGRLHVCFVSCTQRHDGPLLTYPRMNKPGILRIQDWPDPLRGTPIHSYHVMLFSFIPSTNNSRRRRNEAKTNNGRINDATTYFDAEKLPRRVFDGYTDANTRCK